METLKVRPVAEAPKGAWAGLAGEAGVDRTHCQSPRPCCWQGVLDVAHACTFTPDGRLLVCGAADQARRQVHRSQITQALSKMTPPRMAPGPHALRLPAQGARGPVE